MSSALLLTELAERVRLALDNPAAARAELEIMAARIADELAQLTPVEANVANQVRRASRPDFQAVGRIFDEAKGKP